MISALSLIIVFFISLGITGLVRKIALRKNLLDVPNDRSSHKVSTPRGGGLGIVISFLCALAYMWYNRQIPTFEFAAFTGSMVLVALVGLWDDFGKISQKWRFLAHLAAAGWALFWLGDPVLVPLFGYDLFLSNYLEIFVLIIGLVWAINLFNFMDGIDGLAGTEAAFVALAGGLLSTDFSNLTGSILPFYLVAGSLGFLYWNWPPAKIFMGDVASGAIGIILGLFTILNSTAGSKSNLWVWTILVGYFLVDATFTLLQRMFRNEKWYSAHCSHAYQHAAKRWGHLKTTNSVNLINWLWLFPCAAAAKYFPDFGLIVTAIAFTPLIWLENRLGAGVSQDS